jgi:signal recognition particle GTPase
MRSVLKHGGKAAELTGGGLAVIALVGPPGAGKTTMAAKLTVSFGLKARRRTQLFSIDNYRIAASELLRSYVAILGVGFETLETTRALAQALEQCRNKSLILIDTPGYGFGELRESAELGRFLTGRREIETYLVLPASMRTADMNRMFDAFAEFHISKLVFTRVDETETFGPMVSLSARTGLPDTDERAVMRIRQGRSARGWCVGAYRRASRAAADVAGTATSSARARTRARIVQACPRRRGAASVAAADAPPRLAAARRA